MQKKTKIIISVLGVIIVALILIALFVPSVCIPQKRDKFVDRLAYLEIEGPHATADDIFVLRGQTHSARTDDEHELLASIYCDNKEGCRNVTMDITNCQEDLNITTVAQPEFNIIPEHKFSDIFSLYCKRNTKDPKETTIGILYKGTTPGTTVCTVTAEGEGYSASKEIIIEIRSQE